MTRKKTIAIGAVLGIGTAAYLLAPSSRLADLNGDNRIDMRDVAIFQNVFGNASNPDAPPRALGDIDGRNGVDLMDWHLFLISWGR